MPSPARGAFPPADILIPDTGWCGVDPTRGRAVSGYHVRVAYGRDYTDVPPVRGVYRGRGGQNLSVDVRVRPALDDTGCELLREPTGPPRPVPAADPPPQQ